MSCMVMCMMSCNCTMQCQCFEVSSRLCCAVVVAAMAVRPAPGSTPLPHVIHKANWCAESVLVLALNLPQQCVLGTHFKDIDNAAHCKIVDTHCVGTACTVSS
jgi:hypothetical protein